MEKKTSALTFFAGCVVGAIFVFVSVAFNSSEIGRYQFKQGGGDGIFVLDTKTGDIKGFYRSGISDSWDNNYQNLFDGEIR